MDVFYKIYVFPLGIFTIRNFSLQNLKGMEMRLMLAKLAFSLNEYAGIEAANNANEIQLTILAKLVFYLKEYVCIWYYYLAQDMCKKKPES